MKAICHLHGSLPSNGVKIERMDRNSDTSRLVQQVTPIRLLSLHVSPASQDCLVTIGQVIRKVETDFNWGDHMGTGTILNGHFYQQMASFRSFVLALQTNLSYNFSLFTSFILNKVVFDNWQWVTTFVVSFPSISMGELRVCR